MTISKSRHPYKEWMEKTFVAGGAVRRSAGRRGWQPPAWMTTRSPATRNSSTHSAEELDSVLRVLGENGQGSSRFDGR
ncbi:hypothetical protein LNP74_09450 [Klebsiella pneumoniae subsp. pneumoniae]|nr:hypothetical protein [Klebsiella pneumoniae subsp. pneumoniae]